MDASAGTSDLIAGDKERPRLVGLRPSVLTDAKSKAEAKTECPRIGA
jgi:hypothetical protein